MTNSNLTELETQWGVAAVGARFCTRAYFEHQSDATNAMRLAEAAPNLLSALKRLGAAFVAKAETQEQRIACNEAIDAIAKAEGR